MTSLAHSLFFLFLVGISPAHAAGESPEETVGIPHPELLLQIDALQHRADKLYFGKPGANNYHLTKARIWLDVALDEYYENEGNGFVPAAIEQAQSLLAELEKNQADITMDTPQQILGSVTVRPDLWNKISSLKKHDQFSCGQRQLAEAEVHLVWAGHEKAESSWVNAESYARHAEDLIKESVTSINDCVAQLPVIENITLSSDMLFEFGKANLGRSALEPLGKVADRIKMIKRLGKVELIGHTDRLRRDGHPERNQLLSEQRAESVKQYLIGRGIPAEKILASGLGSSQPLIECSTKQSKQEQIACLQPNRRVEIILRGAKHEPDTTRPANPVPATRN